MRTTTISTRRTQKATEFTERFESLWTLCIFVPSVLKCVKEVVVFTILTLSLALQAQEEDNSRLDELGQVPRRHIAFNGSLENSGEEACDWDGKHWAKIKSKAQWCKARGGDDAAMRLGCGEGVFPFFSNMTLGDEWTMVGVVKGIEKENAIIWSLGSARGRGTQAFALASGKNGVKVVQWHGAQKDAQMLVMKDVEHFARQFHVYALVKNADGLQLWVDGKKAGESAAFINDGLGWELTFGAFHWAGKAGGLETGDGVEIDDFRVYDTALSEVQLLQIASGNQPWPEGLPRPKERVSAYVDTNAVLRLGYEIPERVTVGGEDGEKRLYAKGVLAQCGIGGEKRFELKSGGAFALGSKGFVFDSNYAHSRTNEIVFAGGAFAAYEPTFIKSAAPIKLSGKVKIITNKQLLVRASIEGDGDLIKAGGGILGLQYPCDNATGRIVVTNASQLVIGPAGSWGGTIVLGNGGTLKCVSTNQVGRIITLKGGKVVESEPGKTFGKDAFPQPATAYRLDKMQKERMGRGVYAVRTKKDEVMVGWRYKSTDPADIAFNVYANGRKLNAEPIRDVTYFKAPWSGEKTKYTVTGVLPGGREGKFAVSASWTLPANAPVGYFDIELAPPPESIMPDGKKIGHHPCDTSIGDLDGDGEYELVIIWWPDNAADNSSWHATGETWIEGVKLDGTNRSLWKINLGKNIRSGSNYVPVMVCDMNGDGKAEVVCRTADGTIDAKGNVIGDGSKDWRESNGHVLWARNFVTVFDGATGEAVDSVPFKPDVLSDPARRAAKDDKAINREWSSRNPGNQAFRFLSAVAYLDGMHPSVVMCRGYYSRTCMTAYDFDGKNLKERWYFCSDEPRWWGYGGQGFHNLRVGDVDFDGKDEIIYGHMVVDHDGQGLYTTGMGHGDAIHLIQGSPEMRGLQVWTCHENRPFGVSLFDAQTGLVRLWTHGPQDTGSCNAADVDPAAPGVELFSGANCGVYSASTLQRHLHPKPNPKINYYGALRFGIWWKGDLTRSLYSGGSVIRGYSVKGRCVNEIVDFGDAVDSNHSTKGCPCLIADIFGDWREEILLRRRDNKAIRVFMSPEETKYRFHTFLEDPVYRISVLTQNNGYNMPTDPGFYFGPELLGRGITFRGTRLE